MTKQRIKQGLLLILSVLIGSAIAACGTAATPPSDSAPVAEGAPASSSVVGTPVPRSDVGTVFAKPLSSGLSVADITENALPSVVQIITGSGSGTGFIINESGLVVTNKHVVEGTNQVTLRLVAGKEYRGSVTHRDPHLDLAYIEIDATRSFTPIAIGDSDKIRVGEEIIAIGFPLGRSLGLEPTVSVGIISAKRQDRLQTDASLNPGNSGGPLLNMYGEVAGVVVSRVETDDSGRSIVGIGFAIPINAVKAALQGQVSPSGKALPTPTPFPTIGPTPNFEATKAAIDAIDAHRREVELATRSAIEVEKEAERYAAALEATRIAELPTPTPEPTPTPLPPTPTPTPHPATFCQEWEALVLEWIKEGNYFWGGQWWVTGMRSTHDVPDHAQLPAVLALEHCAIDFPTGTLGKGSGAVVGDGENQLLPGTYEYRHEGYEGDNRVKGHDCLLRLNRGEDSEQSVEMPYGEPFTFRFLADHRRVLYDGTYYLTDCGGSADDSGLYRIGD